MNPMQTQANAPRKKTSHHRWLVLLICLLSFGLSQQRLKAQDTWLMVLDMQDFQLKDQSLNASIDSIIPHINRLIAAFGAERVIYVRATGKSLNISLKGIRTDTLPAKPFYSRLEVVNNNCFNKVEGDAFTVCELRQFLENRQVTDIVLVGILADKCIYHTALGGSSRGYRLTLVPEATVGSTTRKQAKAFEAMKAKGLMFKPLHEIIH